GAAPLPSEEGDVDARGRRPGEAAVAGLRKCRETEALQSRHILPQSTDVSPYAERERGEGRVRPGLELPEDAQPLLRESRSDFAGVHEEKHSLIGKSIRVLRDPPEEIERRVNPSSHLAVRHFIPP